MSAERRAGQRRAQGRRHDACAAQGGKGKGAQNQSKLSTSGSWLDALTCNLLKIVEGVVIPIRPFLAGQAFDPETIA